jgi:hypothetical protein
MVVIRLTTRNFPGYRTLAKGVLYVIRAQSQPREMDRIRIRDRLNSNFVRRARSPFRVAMRNGGNKGPGGEHKYSPSILERLYQTMSNSTSDSNPKFELYRYDPTLEGAVLFSLLFLVTTVLQLYQLIKTKTWYFIPIFIGGVCKSRVALIKLRL